MVSSEVVVVVWVLSEAQLDISASVTRARQEMMSFFISRFVVWTTSIPCEGTSAVN